MSRLPSLPWQGHCQCGQAQYTITKVPLTLYACHCSECQQQSASAFGLSLWVEKSAFETTGAIQSWSRKADSGNTMHCHFCPQCGSRLWHESEKPHPVYGQLVSIKGGSLPLARDFAPIGHIWTGSKHAATNLLEDKLIYPDDRIDDAALVDAWKNYIAEFETD